MASTVEVQMKLDDSGVVQRIEAQGQAFEEVAQSANDASEATERNAEATQDAGSAAERGAQAQREQAQAAEVNEQAQRDAAQSARQYAAASDQMAGASSNASQVIFSTGDAIQDVQFGFAGAANNIAFVAESFAELQRQAGGTQGAFASLGSALTGPAGVILALQALLALGPQIASFFTGAEEQTESFADTLEDTVDEVVSLSTKFDDLEASVTPDNLDSYTESLKTSRNENRRLLSALTEVQGGFQRLGRDVQDIFATLSNTAFGTDFQTNTQEALGGAQDLAERLGLEVDTVTAAIKGNRSALQQVGDALDKQPGLVESVSRRQKALNDLIEQAETARQKETAQQEALNAAKEAGAETESGVDLESISLAAEGVKEYNNLVEQQPELENPLPTDLTEGEQAIAGIRDQIESVNAMPFLNQASKGEKRIQAVVNGIREAQAAGREFSEDEINMIINALGLAGEEAEEVRNKLEGTADAATGAFQELESVVSGALASGFRELGAAIGEGQAAMEALGAAAAKVLAQIGQAIGKQLIAQGTAMIAAGNPTGAAYIAAGGTIIAASSALSSLAGGSGAGGAGAEDGTTEQAQTERGGEIGAEVDAPGRRRGGPVQGGRLYETHGLGQREFFRPAMDGQILTAGGMRAAAGAGRGGAMTVNVQADGQISAEDFDIASLRAELNELSADVSDLS
jgi:hypothetical protein